MKVNQIKQNKKSCFFISSEHNTSFSTKKVIHYDLTRNTQQTAPNIDLHVDINNTTTPTAALFHKPQNVQDTNFTSSRISFDISKKKKEM